ncbi:hypothetical protein RN001_002176 [Aquatica leii]|uniref:Palmitoyltransferase n=1 Tax=Aquatica leii TaxID=1421715 RepID=A0AAN7QAY7_9COLE|nr:hypothetical protein RN001_002176 [Aquatica leii]
MFVKDPCGIICVFVTYGAVFYADYVVIRWIVLQTMFDSLWGPFNAVVFNTIVFLLLMSHIRAVFSDPGVVPLPQNRVDFSDIHSAEAGCDHVDWTVCTRCEMYRPPRAHHCRICKRCIRRMDHHCPWINNCVGERNQKYFMQFLVYVGILSGYAIVLVVISWIKECPDCDSTVLLKQSRIMHCIILLLESALFGMFVAAILIDQLQAIFGDETAVEQVQQKGPYRAHKSKFALLSEFAKYGHECDMENELDELPHFLPGKSWYARLKRELMRFRMVSETNKRCTRHLRSQGAIAFEKHKHLKTYPYMVHPFSDARKYFECLMCFVLFIQFIMVPLDVSCYRKSENNIHTTILWKSIRMAMDILCLLDVCASFITGFFNEQKKQAELSPQKVAVKYCYSYFLIDLIASIPTHVEIIMDIENEDVIAILQLLSLLKLFRFQTFIKYCKNIEETFEIPYALYKIVMVCIITCLYYHFIACNVMLFRVYSMGLFSKNKINTRFERDLSYSRAYYKTLLMARVSSFRDRSTESLELAAIVFIWIISKILFILIIGKLMQVLKATTSSRQKYIEMVRQLRQFMGHRQLPEHMQRRLLTYYKFRFQKSYFRESEILSTISGQLRQEIVMHSCRKLVENVAFFNNIPFTLLARIVSCLRSEVFLVNDVIVRAATAGNSMFFIASGTVAVYTSSGREICHLEDGAHFGEIALVMRDELRVASVVAVDVCELYRLDRKEFVRAIHPYPDLLDNIQRIAADRMERTNMLDEHDRREMASKRLY